MSIESGAFVSINGTDAAPYRGIRVGENAGSEGTLTVDGVGSTLTSQGGAGLIRIAANFGEGTLNVTNGGQV